MKVDMFLVSLETNPVENLDYFFNLGTHKTSFFLKKP
jgi:hypothetical protein